MKKVVPKNQANRLLNCGMVVMVSCAYKDKANITTCAWQMPLSKKPPAAAVALDKDHFSSDLMRESEEFIINIPDWSILDQVVKCGSWSGWNVDKFAETGLNSEKAHSLVNIPKVKECVGALECAVFDIKDVGDHHLFFGEVISAEAEEDYFKEGFWDTRKVQFIFHLGSRYFFKSSEFIEVEK
ncbi:flavin reductase family protein [bacterium]|nr:flavin reductase family protein [bacterium]